MNRLPLSREIRESPSAPPLETARAARLVVTTRDTPVPRGARS